MRPLVKSLGTWCASSAPLAGRARIDTMGESHPPTTRVDADLADHGVRARTSTSFASTDVDAKKKIRAILIRYKPPGGTSSSD